MSKYFIPSPITYSKVVNTVSNLENFELQKLAHGPEPREDGSVWDEKMGGEGFPIDFEWDFDSKKMVVNPKTGFCSKKLNMDLLKKSLSVLDQGKKETYIYSYPPIGYIESTSSGIIPNPFPKGINCVICGDPSDISNPQLYINDIPQIPNSEISNIYHSTECFQPNNNSLVISEYGASTVFKDKPVGYPYIPVKTGKTAGVKQKSKTMTYLSIKYKYTEQKKPCEIRFFNNGTYTIISAPWELVDNKNFEKEFLTRVKKSLETQGIKYVVNENTTQVNGIGTWFDTIKSDKENKNLILNKIIEQIPNEITIKNRWKILSSTLKKTIKGDATTISAGSILFKMEDLQNPIVNISFNLLEKGSVNLNFALNKSIKEQLEKEIIQGINVSKNQKNLKLLDKNYVTVFVSQIQPFFEELYKQPSIIQEISSKNLLNLRDEFIGKPSECRGTPPNDKRPKPYYSFYGTCPGIGQGGLRHAPMPWGIKTDASKGGWYVPCCSSLTKSGKFSEKVYKEFLKWGFPQIDENNREIPFNGELLSTKYEVGQPDTMGAVYINGTKTIESRRFKGLMHLNENKLLNCIQQSGKMDEFIKWKESTSGIQPTTTLTPDMQNLTNKLKKLTDAEIVPFYFTNILSKLSFKKMNVDPYIVYGIPQNSKTATLFIDENGFLHVYNGVKTISSSVNSSVNYKNSIFFGTFNGRKKTLYIVDVMFFKGKDVSENIYYDVNKSIKSRLSMIFSFMFENQDTPEIKIDRDVQKWDFNLIEGTNNFLTKQNSMGILFINIIKPLKTNTINIDNYVWYKNFNPNEIYVTAELNWNEQKWQLYWNNNVLTNKIVPNIESYTLPNKYTTNLDTKNSYDLVFKLNIINNQWQYKPIIPYKFLSNIPFNSIIPESTPVSYFKSVENFLKQPIDQETLTNITYGGLNQEYTQWTISSNLIVYQDRTQLPSPFYFR